MPRHLIAGSGVLVMAIIGQSVHGKPPSPPAQQAPFHIIEATIPEMRDAMERGRLTSHDLALQYLARIGMYQQKLHAAV